MRRSATLLATLVLAGCGFHPVYAPLKSGQASPAAQQLAAIHVMMLPDRLGQILRQDLQERFERFGIDAPELYDLTVAFTIIPEGISIDYATSQATYVRITGRSDWSLRAKNGTAILTRGVARAVDGYNVFDQQYFAADLSNSMVSARVASLMSDQIALQLAGYFETHAIAAAAAPAAATPAAATPATTPETK